MLQVLSLSHNAYAVSMMKLYCRPSPLTQSNYMVLLCSVSAKHMHICSMIICILDITVKTWCPQFFSKLNLPFLLLLNDKSPVYQKPEWTGNLRVWPMSELETLLCYQSIPTNKTACSDGESWIYFAWCNSLNCCLCPFIIINHRAVEPKEQFRALQSYAIAESIINLRKII